MSEALIQSCLDNAQEHAGAPMERKIIAVSNIFFDQENPRIRPQTGQREAINAIIESKPTGLLNLAKHIGANGLSPIDNIMVVRDVTASKGKERYIVVEGNRRIAAIKLMLEPALSEDEKIAAKFKQISRKYDESVPRYLDCVISPDVDAALPWIGNKHSLGQDGTGTDPWNAEQKRRFDIRRGRNHPPVALLDFAIEFGKLDENAKLVTSARKFKITNLERLVGESIIQDMLGFKLTEDGEILVQTDQKDFTKVISKIINDLAKRDFKVSRIYDQVARIKYIQEVLEETKCNSAPTSAPWKLGEGVTKKTEKVVAEENLTISISPRPGRGATENRPTLIPKSFKISVNTPKLANILDELKNIKVDKHPNAPAILLRVFLELSLEQYAIGYGLVHPSRGIPITAENKLREKLQAVIRHMKESRIMTDKELKAANTAISDPNSLLSIETLHAYVHDSDFSPIPGDLKRTWDNMETFFKRLWDHMP